MFFFRKLTDAKIKHRQNKGKPVSDFHGGIHPPENKSPANLHDIKRLPLVDFYSIPLHQHIGSETELIVKEGQQVLRGEPLTIGFGNQVPIHAPTSGVIKGIIKQPSTDYFSEEGLAVLLESDKEDKPYTQSAFDYLSAKPEQIIEQIHLNGVVGLGGAGFPTAIKLNHKDDGIRIHTLIVNAAECEPFISSDDRLMREHANDLIRGLDIVRKILHPKMILIGIEDNKQEAISALESALEHTHIDLIRLATKVIVIPTKYPSGGAKQLVTLLTGKEIPSGKHASDIGISMLNVGTLYAIKQAIIDREPLIERVVTLAGQNFIEPANYWVRIGTPIASLLQQVNFDLEQLKTSPLIMGGPMMGYPISELSSVVKTTNCLLSRNAQELGIKKDEQPCIRCGECTAVCPAQLLPQQLFWYSQGHDHEKSKQFHLFDCIECGACEYVCPSHIPLVHYYKIEKKLIKHNESEERLAAEAKERYETKLARLEAEKVAREARHKQISTDINEKDKSAVEAAIARVKAKKMADQANGNVNSANMEQTPESMTELSDGQKSDTRQDKIQAAIARAKAKKAGTVELIEGQPAATQNESILNNQPESQLTNETSVEQDPRKAAVAAALARAKSKRKASADANEQVKDDALNAQVSNESTSVNETNIHVDDNEIKQMDAASAPQQDPRKVMVQAAIERAKAKRLAKNEVENASSLQQASSVTLNNSEKSVNTEVKTAKQAAIDAALIRAKARKSKLDKPPTE